MGALRIPRKGVPPLPLARITIEYRISGGRLPRYLYCFLSVN